MARYPGVRAAVTVSAAVLGLWGVGAAGCFQTPLNGDIACGAGDLCPDGLDCIEGVCRRPGFVTSPTDAAPITPPGDGGSADAGPDGPDASTGLGNFGTPMVVAPGTISTTGTTLAQLQDDPSVTGDGLEIYYNLGQAQIMVSTRPNTSAAWGTPTSLSAQPPDGIGAGDAPFILPDGLTLYFSYRDLPVQNGGRQQIFRTTRASRTDSWASPPLIVGSPIDQGAPVDSLTPCLTSDDKVMIFASDRVTDGQFDLYRTTRASTSDPWGTPALITGIASTTSNELNCWVADDESVLYFGSNRDDPDGAKVFMATGDGNGNYTNPTAVPVLNDAGSFNADPSLSPDQRTVYFARAVSGDLGDIYTATR